MKRQLGKIAAALMVLFGFVQLTASLHAQSTFVYTNNSANGPNSVSAFSVGSNGALTPVAGSPFATGGVGALPNVLLAPGLNRIAIAGNFLYASNDGTSNISGFSIDTVTGVLTPVPGSPFATGEVNTFDIPLAVTPDGQFLYAGNTFGGNVSAFSIASNGALALIPGSPFPVSFPINMKVTPDRKFLAVAQANLAMFSIGPNGALTPGPVFGVSGGSAEAVDVNCASNLLFAPVLVPSLSGPGLVNVLNLASNGILTPIAGSPFTFSGSESLDEVLSSDDRHLFVGNFFSQTITSFDVASGGSLTQVSGSPFPSGTIPSTVATNQAGTLLYVTSEGPILSGFSIDSNGALSPVPGSPFSVGISVFSEPSVAVFPPKSCSQAPTITSISPTSAVAGGAGFILTVNGMNFVSGSTVDFNGTARTTTFVSTTQVTAVILASDIATDGTFSVTVANPGGIRSNAVSFTVLTPQQATQAITDSVNVLFSQGVINGGQDNSLIGQLQHAITMMNAGKNAGAIGNLGSFISEVNDLLSSGVLSPSQAASLTSAAQSVIAAI